MAAVKFFAGIVPPAEIYNRILNIQTQYGNNRLEPHITLRPPVVPLDIEQWTDTISRVAAANVPFTIKLPGTGNFGSRVLFISVQSDPLFDLYQQIIQALKPFEPDEQTSREEQYHPHLTLGRAWCGFTKDDFTAMRNLANEYLKNDNVAFEISAIRIYHKPDAHKGFQLFKDVPLGAEQ